MIRGKQTNLIGSLICRVDTTKGGEQQIGIREASVSNLLL